ncbi:MAG: Na(+)-translocating NADH-quinone reductase subunit C [Myxococcota bacterium]|nr:Na(+)-translocating NADH-quinone reductase subunit C [Myxococcota bacterium]
MPKNFTTGYNIFFAAAVCVFWSILVSASAVSLKDRQEKNRQFDKQRNVLYATGLATPDGEMSREDMMATYKEKIRAYVIERKTGKVQDGIDAAGFDQKTATLDAKQSMAAPKNIAGIPRLPNNAIVYHLVDGETVEGLVLPIVGRGLWSTMYGYLALDADTKTVRGVAFYEHKETPGLGAEIENPKWTATWKGREVVDDAFKPVFNVKKGGAGSVAEDPHNVDSITGATLTSVGVANTVQFWLGEHGFGPYLETFRQGR